VCVKEDECDERMDGGEEGGDEMERRRRGERSDDEGVLLPVF